MDIQSSMVQEIYYTEAQPREQTRTDIIVDYLGKQHVYQTIHMFFPLVHIP